jgi:hypothetical protein
MKAGRPTVIITWTLFAVQVLTGSLWTLLAIGNVSTYGDSTDYLILARTLEIPDYRGVAYPAFIHVLSRIFPNYAVQAVYLVQMAVSAWAAWYFLRTAFRLAAPSSAALGRIRGWRMAALAAATVSAPLWMHFSLAVMPDILVSSFTLLFIAALAASCASEAGILRKRSLALAWVMAGMLPLLRPEKIYVVLPLVAGAYLLSAVPAWRRESRNRVIRAQLLGGLTFILSILAVVHGIRGFFPQASSRNPPFSNVRVRLANRVTYGVFKDVYPYLEPATRERIGPKDVERITAHRRNLNLVLKRILTGDPAQDNPLLDDIILQSLARQPAKVLYRAAFDLSSYLLVPAAFYYQYFFKTRVDNFSIYTVDKMASQTAWGRFGDCLTRFYVFFSLLVVVWMWFVVLRHRGTGPRLPKRLGLRLLFGLTLLYHLANSLMFGLFDNLFHIRYALPSFLLFLMWSIFLLGQQPPFGADVISLREASTET